MRLQYNTFSSRFEWAAFKNEIRNSNTNQLKEMLSLLLKEISEMILSHQTTLSHQDQELAHQELAHRWNQIAIILDERDLRFLRDEKDCYFEVKFNQAPLQAHQAWKLAKEHYWESPRSYANGSYANADCIDHAINAEEQAARRLQALLLKIMESSLPPPYASAVTVAQQQSVAAQPQPAMTRATTHPDPQCYYRFHPYSLFTNALFFENQSDVLYESKGIFGRL